jgi:hypothetical protein
VTNVFPQAIKVSGRLLNNKTEAVEFANVTLKSTEIFYGGASDEYGRFVIQVTSGNYIIRISAIGYETYEKEIAIEKDMDLGEIRMVESTVEVGEVVVKAQRVVRKADRFIINIANDPAMVGKTGSEALALSPGVFVRERDGVISINGKSGTRVIVNERPLRERGADLMRYLQTLKAEDIVRIEVLPTSGAEYDANNSGGAIKITLKRQREDGMNGNVGASYAFAQGEDVSSFGPSLSMNYKNKRLSLYTGLNYDTNRTIEYTTDEINLRTTNKRIQSHSDISSSNNTGRIRAGGVYDFNHNQSVGLEAYYSRDLRKNRSVADLTETMNENRTDIVSLYSGKNTRENYSLSANYFLPVDSLGSLFKLLLDYHHNGVDNDQDYHSEFRGFVYYDSIYRSDVNTQNDLYAASADLSLHINDHTTFGSGLKYTRNRMNSGTLFEYLIGTAWCENPPYSSQNEFSENITGLYVSFSSRVKKVSYALGLRGEYTYALPWTNQTEDIEKQRYFNLFPSVNIMLPFGGKGQHFVVLNYNRKIRRPTFSHLNPYRLPVSEYTYIEGNPRLRAALSDDYSVAMGLFNRYYLTVGVTDTKGAFNRVSVVEPDLPNVVIMRVDNVARYTTCYLGINASLKPFKWWQINLNVLARKDDVEIFGEKRTIEGLQTNIAQTFYLPNDYFLDISAYYATPFIDGNMKTKTDPQVSASLRKQFFNKRLTATFSVNNIPNIGTARISVDEKDFRRYINSRYGFMEFGASLRYNFKAGKNVRVKKTETGAAEEKLRLE